MKKLLSGRFWLTLMAGYAFVYCVINRILPDEAIALIIFSVFREYFNKKEDK